MKTYDEIRAGQVYRSADPRDSIRIRILWWSPGQARAWVCDADDGKRSRHVLVRNIHLSTHTKTGAVRRTGYVPEG